MANPTAITLHNLEAESSDDQGDSVDIEETRSAAELVVHVTALGASPLILTLQTSPDDSTWRDVMQLGEYREPGMQKFYAADLDQYVRVEWDVSTSATFRVVGKAFTLYADQLGLLSALPQDVFEQCAEWKRVKALISASSIIETIAYSAGDVPLTAWGESLRLRCEQIAAGLVQRQHELAGGGVDKVVSDAYTEALGWVDMIRKGELKDPQGSPSPANLVQYSSGNPDDPDTYVDLFSHDFGDF